MKWLSLICGSFILVALAVLLVGLLQPVKHSVARSIHLKQKPETVFAVLNNSAELPKWSSTVMQVEPLPDRDGKPSAKVTMKWGRMQMIMTQLESTPPTRSVVSMAKEGGPVMGTWTYKLAVEREGCRVMLTEDGELKNPFFRAIGRMRGLDGNIRQTLCDLAAKFGESVVVQVEK
jgi:ribosome-associated toxin RatA of RatAB toxin-antitoxin module